MGSFFRYAFVSIAGVFLVAIVVQVFFAGLMLFGQQGGRALHRRPRRSSPRSTR